MSQDHINKLYTLLAKILRLLESDIDGLQVTSAKDDILLKKTITDSLSKLALLLAQLNKLSKEENASQAEAISEVDRKIIEQFIKNYQN